MPQENENHRDKTKRFAPGRNPDAARTIEETEGLLRNTRAFLDGLRESDEKTRAYIREISESLERDIQRLRNKTEAK